MAEALCVQQRCVTERLIDVSHVSLSGVQFCKVSWSVWRSGRCDIWQCHLPRHQSAPDVMPLSPKVTPPVYSYVLLVCGPVGVFVRRNDGSTPPVAINIIVIGRR